MAMLLFFLKVLVAGPVNPDDASEQNQSEGRKDYEVVGNVAGRKYLKSENGTASEKLAEECYDDQNQSVAESVCKTVKKGGNGLVAKGESLDTSHHYTVGDNQSDIDGELLVHIIGESLQNLVHKNNHHSYNHELDDDADSVWNGVPHQGDYQA